MAVLHPNLASLARFVGKWKGSGSGGYPTVPLFTYDEEVTITHNGKPFLAYAQKTTNPSTNAPLHAECGYFRVPLPPKIEFVNAQPTGICEIDEGEIDGGGGGGFTLRSVNISRTGSAKAPHATKTVRRFELVDDNTMKITMQMATTNTPELTHHLESILRRTE